MSYQVLALKYRSQTFQDVIGQPHVTTTLANAISSDRVAHAILFTGPRGTGKTTIARILAKAMNCADGPAPTPCNQCNSCKSITASSSPDVFEIDGASNNSVDQIRDLRDNVAYMPSSSTYKIYIIDEVHMLSNAAFNALLKTLEEPPAHVIFIFATTESHKIPVTILSRCQRHDLGRIPLSLIAGHLQDLCRKEGFTLSEESINLIAAEADGSMRDALSLLDRIISSSPEKVITHESIIINLGIIDKLIIFDISAALFKSNGAKLLELINRVHEQGHDLKKFYSNIISHFRDLAVVKICKKNTNVADMSNHDREKIISMVESLSQTYLTQILDILLKEETLIRFSSHTKSALEMVLLKLVQIRPGFEIDELIEKLDNIAKRIDISSLKQTPQANNREETTPGSMPGSMPGSAQTEGSTKNSMQAQGSTKNSIPAENSASHVGYPQSTHKPLSIASPAADFGSASVAGQTPAPAGNSVYVSNSVPAVDSNPGNRAYRERSATVDNPNVTTSWKGFIKQVASTLPFVSAILNKARFKEISEHALTFELYGTSFEMTRVKGKINDLEQICKTYFGKKLKIDIINKTSSQKKFTEDEKSPAKLKQAVLNHPIVVDAVKIFNGTIVDVNTG